MNKTPHMIAITALAASLAGCGGPNDFKPAVGMSAAEIFSNACAACHGDDGKGKFGFLLNIAGADDSAEEIANMIKEGGYIMPSFPNISDEERLIMAAYVKAL